MADDGIIFEVEARPYAYSFSRYHTALLVIDEQRDFLHPGGFGSSQAVDLSDVVATLPYVQRLLALFRSLDMAVFYTREGHNADLSDCPSSKLLRNIHSRPEGSLQIGDKGSMGRLLIRGEHGQEIVDEVKPLPGEVVIDKPGKGAFWNTSLMDELRARAITHLVVCGVTTECCFSTTIREANDRGFECCGVVEGTAGYVKEFKSASLDMIDSAGGLFGFTASIAGFEKAVGWAKTTENGNATSNSKWNGDISISALRSFYRSGGSVTDVVGELYDRIESYARLDSSVWIHLEPRASVLKVAKKLEAQYNDPARGLPPLFGIPFTVKDSLNVAGVETTTACPPLAYTPETSARVCEKVLLAGALFLGKVNLDQFATGLSGCRSPFGTLHSTFSDAFISGGSSSGSCVSVGARLCSFSIATDTAGSGRVPAGFNGVIGFKPTRGTISTVGLVPACPSLDCIALMAGSVADARYVWTLVTECDPQDPYSKWTVSRPRPVHSIGPQKHRFRFGIPSQDALTICCPVFQRKFHEACQALSSIGGEQVLNVDWDTFEKAGDLLYAGSFVCERLATLPDHWVEYNKDNLHPVVCKLLQDVEARKSSAVDAYRDLIARAKYTKHMEQIFAPGSGGIDVLIVPTAPIHWTIAEMNADPIVKNAHLGTFTHYGNVLDLCAVAVPAGTYQASDLAERCPGGHENDRLPFGITLLGLSGTDAEVLEIARRFTSIPS